MEVTYHPSLSLDAIFDDVRRLSAYRDVVLRKTERGYVLNVINFENGESYDDVICVVPKGDKTVQESVEDKTSFVQFKPEAMEMLQHVVSRVPELKSFQFLNKGITTRAVADEIIKDYILEKTEAEPSPYYTTMSVEDKTSFVQFKPEAMEMLQHVVSRVPELKSFQFLNKGIATRAVAEEIIKDYINSILNGEVFSEKTEAEPSSYYTTIHGEFDICLEEKEIQAILKSHPQDPNPLLRVKSDDFLTIF